MVISDRDVKFTSKFRKILFGGIGTQLNFSVSYHPQTNGKTKRMNQILDGILRMYVMDKPTKSEYFLHLAEFYYNNSYQDSIKISLFKALYGRKFHTPLS